MKRCLICNKDISKSHHNKKYCGKNYQKNTCSWKVAVLGRKLITIKERCYNPQHSGYKYYNKVDICKSWLKDSFSFVRWSLNNGWDYSLQIDRIKNDRGYYPKNCRFVTSSENCRNKKNVNTDWVNKTRQCRICKIRKSFSEFTISRKEIGGIAYECKLCKKEKDRLRWMKIKSNPIKLKEYYEIKKPYQRALYARRKVK